MSYLVLEQIHKRFGNTSVVHSVDLEVEQGELMSLLGPSGCGKTTTLRIVAGLERADSGRVLVDGRAVTDVPANQRDMGMVFQAYSLFPNMTAAENVAYGLRVHGWKRQRRTGRAGELLDLVGLAEVGERYPDQLSGGMQQRVALARALAIQPRILLLDEPLSALDAKVRVQLREEVRRIQSEVGTTTLYVTHDQEEALSISDRVAIFQSGRVEQVATPVEIYNRPRTPFVADFVGTATRLEVQVEDPLAGYVRCRGGLLKLSPLNGWRRGEHMTIFVRPEEVRVEAATVEREFALNGRVISHSFLGANTRLKIDIGEAILAADVPNVVGVALPIGSQVSTSFLPGAVMVLGAEQQTHLGPDSREQAGRSKSLTWSGVQNDGR